MSKIKPDPGPLSSKGHNENLIRIVESGLQCWRNLVEKVNAKKIDLTFIMDYAQRKIIVDFWMRCKYTLTILRFEFIEGPKDQHKGVL